MDLMYFYGISADCGADWNILLFLLVYCDRKLDIRIKKLHQDIAELEMIFKDKREHHLEKFLMMVNNWDDPDKQV
jgi:hypothetical protein